MFDLVDAFDSDEEGEKSKAVECSSPRHDEDTPAAKEPVRPPFADFTASRGVRIRFEMRGSTDLPPLLQIPGETDDLRKDLTKEPLKVFSSRFCVVQCDLRNQGETRPFTLDRYLPLSTYVDDLLALVDDVFGADVAINVMGWSFGAVLGMAMARLHPTRVRKLIVVSGGYFEPQPEHIGHLKPGGECLFGKDWQWVQDMINYDKLNVKERCYKMLLHADVRRRDKWFRDSMVPPFQGLHDIYAHTEKMTVMAEAEKLGQGVLLQEIALFAEGTSGVQEIETPTLIVHGRHDGVHPVKRAQELASRVRNSKLAIMEDHGHVLPMSVLLPISVKFLQKPLEVAPTSKFLGAHPYLPSNMEPGQADHDGDLELVTQEPNPRWHVVKGSSPTRSRRMKPASLTSCSGSSWFAVSHEESAESIDADSITMEADTSSVFSAEIVEPDVGFKSEWDFPVASSSCSSGAKERVAKSPLRGYLHAISGTFSYFPQR